MREICYRVAVCCSLLVLAAALLLALLAGLDLLPRVPTTRLAAVEQQLFSARPAAAGAPRLSLLVCYPGGTVDPAQARPHLEKMLGVLERLGGWGAGSIRSTFSAEANECRRRLAEDRPALVILSLELFLEQRQSHSLLPLVRPSIAGRVTEQWRVLVRRGTAHSLADLRGRKLGGTPVANLQLLRRVVLSGKIAPADPSSYFELEPSRLALRSLRRLAAGELDAVLVDGLQYTALAALPFAAELEPVFTSAPLPLLGLAVNERLVSAPERVRLTDAMTRLCSHADGKAICELFGLEAFLPVSAEDYRTVIELWEAGR